MYVPCFMVALGYAGYVHPTPLYEDLAFKYAPQFRLHPNDTFLPSSIEFMLPHYKVYDNNGIIVANQPAPLTTTNLASSLEKNGSGTWLTVADYSSVKSTLLRGQDPRENDVPVYTFTAPKANGVVDFYYWTFYPWNQGKNVVVLGEVGDHVGDWERMSVRMINGTAVSADYNAHSGGRQSAGTIQWSDVPKVPGEDRPIGWVALGSHGIWDSVGSHVYQNIIIYQLTDITADGGPTWDSQASLLPIAYIPGGPYRGTLSWLNYLGAWGNKGLTNCWWHPIVAECSLSDGPIGPARDSVLGAFSIHSEFSVKSMSGPPSNTLATAIPVENSIYLIHIDPQSEGSAYIGVLQICVGFQGSDTLTSTTFGSVSASEVSQGTLWKVIVAGCNGGAYVDSFEVSACTASGQDSCRFIGMRGVTSRIIRAYEKGKSGVVKASAVEVSDPDYWRI